MTKQPNMLELTLGTEFVPGTNLRGQVAGANWTYLLPSLQLDTTVCIGMPSVATLHTLTALAQRVLVCVSAPDRTTVSDPSAQANVTLLLCDQGSLLPIESASIDLVYLPDSQLLRSWATLPAEIRRVLRPEGHVYFEARRGQRFMADLPMTRFWLTPLRGEMHTAVPADDKATQRYFLHRRLFSPSITVQTIKRAARNLRQRRKGTPAVRSNTVTTGGEGETTAANNNKQRPALDALRLLGNRTIDTLATIEGRLQHLIPLAGRYGWLGSPQAPAVPSGPPAYLCALGDAAGIDLSEHRWGLWAGGQYSSRKLLFFLFDPASGQLDYLVKMVRDPRFNKRLENESRALKHLEALGFASSHALPRVAFDGHHHGLAIVGETAVNGVPFKDRTALTATCPVARSAIQLLTDLGQATATPDEATPQAVAAALGTLFERFQAIYQLPANEAHFMTEQIAALGTQSGTVPLVFQHGDPGPWNMMVTPTQQVILLDWESAEIRGLPLWDLFYFLRSYAVNVARAEGVADRLRGFAAHFFEPSTLNQVIVEAVHDYCHRVKLDPHYIEPLFYTCWMHRALKQATLLQSHMLAGGYYVNVLRQAIEKHQSTGLQRLFGNYETTT